MKFTDIIKQYDPANINRRADNNAAALVNADRKLRASEYLSLLSSTSVNIEELAQAAHRVTRKQFGNVMLLFTPLYVSNLCDNVCPYCSFAHQHKIKRLHLSIDDVTREAENIAATGMRHILMLTGESRGGAPVSYLKECARVLKKYFSSIAVEVYPLDRDEYAELVDAGVDGLTIYQETYDRAIYESLHRGGPKVDFEYRLLAPERAADAGVRSITVGPLLGLAPSLSDVFFAGLHAEYLRGKFPSLEIAVSFPRLRPLAGEFDARFPVDDKTFVRYMTAFRLFMPSAGFTVSTRESASFRDSIAPLGATKMSAGVSTSVGAHLGIASEPQFEIADGRSVEEMKRDLLTRGFQPVMVDWNHALCR